MIDNVFPLKIIMICMLCSRTSTSKVLVSCSDLMLTSYCTSRAAFVGSSNLFSIHKTSLPIVCKTGLLNKCTQNQFSVQMYTKLVTNKWNVQGLNITNYLSYLACLYLPLPASCCPFTAFFSGVSPNSKVIFQLS